MPYSDNLITKELRIFSQSVDPRELFPVLMPETANLVIKDPYTFTIATCLDRRCTTIRQTQSRNVQVVGDED